eukprot:Rhum_TRINITY_DN15155_c1_g1::Rhum_TRINITY_DN15155_c1_g1_i1::g.140765::m.140765
MAGSNVHVVLFSKYPLPGKSKTRLIPALGKEGAAFAQVVMTEKLLCELSQRTPFQPHLYYTHGDLANVKYWLGRRFAGLQYHKQAEGSLGKKIASAFDERFAAGADKVVIVGADIPSITGEAVLSAVRALDRNPMVIRAAQDGGYVLVGLARGAAAPPATDPLFVSNAGIAWGTETVLEQQLQAARDAGIAYEVVDTPLPDVDDPEDVPNLLAAVGPLVARSTFTGPTIAIVTPALNEGASIRRCIGGWLASATAPDRIQRVVVSDGGSTDDTAAEAQAAGDVVTVVHGEKGRGAQLAAGVEAATGCDVVIMVHADTVLPKGFDEIIVATLRTPGVSAGAFRLSLDEPSWSTDLVMAGAFRRSRVLETPYGDQAIFVLAKTLSEVGGVRKDYPLLEDLELVSRLRRVGHIV